MQLFKHKKKSYAQKDNFSHPTTIDDKHQLKVREIEDAYQSIPQYEESINRMKRQLKELSKKKTKDLTSEELEEKLHIAERISELEKEIEVIRSKYMNREYELNTCHTLYFYYDDTVVSTATKGNTGHANGPSVVCKASDGPTVSTSPSSHGIAKSSGRKTSDIKRGPPMKRNILDFLGGGSGSGEKNDNPVSTVTTNESSSSDARGASSNTVSNNQHTVDGLSDSKNDTISTDVRTSKSKTELMEEYLSYVDPNYIKKDITTAYTDMCSICKEHRIYDLIHSTLVCPNCGTEEKILIDSEIPSYKEPPREVTYFAYKRINHFNEWLSQLQAKESTNIDRSVFDKIYGELDKEKYIDRSTIDTKKILEILKKLNMPKYYEHCSYIANHISGRPPLIIDADTEEKARNMFKEIQGPWMKYCKPGRSNFFSYPYILYKFFQLLEKDNYLPMLRLLKTREKLQEQDDIWKKICEDLRWEFIRTV
jgi:predicted amidophosphoribosyltransferase